MTKPIVRVQTSEANRIILGERIRSLACSAAELPFETKNANRARIELRTRGPIGLETVTIRLGRVGGGAYQPGLNAIYRVNSSISLRVEDITVEPNANGSLSARRTMHDHRDMICRWRSLWESAETEDLNEQISPEIIHLAATYIAACAANDGLNIPLRVIVRGAAGALGPSIRISGSQSGMNPNSLGDDYPQASQTLAKALHGHIPQATRFVQDSRLGDTIRIEPLVLGHADVSSMNATDILRTMTMPIFEGLPFTLKATA